MMRENFTITPTGEPPLGDYFPFVISDGTEEREGRITNAALARLDSSMMRNDIATFTANAPKIRKVVARKISGTPRDEAVMVFADDLN